MSRAVLSLGSNIGDRTAHLQTAVRSLGRTVRAVSAIYRTPPWGGVEQPDFYNIVVIAEDDGVDPHAWWQRCQALERDAGRERTVHWGPRTLDADVILVEVHGHAVISDEPELIRRTRGPPNGPSCSSRGSRSIPGLSCPGPARSPTCWTSWTRRASPGSAMCTEAGPPLPRRPR